MEKKSKLSKHGYVIWLVAGFVVGYFFWDNSAEVVAMEERFLALNREFEESNTAIEQRVAKEEFFDGMVAKSTARQKKIYDPLFENWGVSSHSSKIFESMAVIFKKSLWAEDAIVEVIQARQTFEQEVESLIGPEAYIRFRDHELTKSARREYEKINTLLTSQGDHKLTTAQVTKLVSLLQASGAYSGIEEWHGPFDRIPEPVIGLDDSIQAHKDAVAELTIKGRALIQSAQDAGLSSELIGALDAYYNEVVDRKRSTMDQMTSLKLERMNKSKSVPGSSASNSMKKIGGQWQTKTHLPKVDTDTDS